MSPLHRSGFFVRRFSRLVGRLRACGPEVLVACALALLAFVGVGVFRLVSDGFSVDQGVQEALSARADVLRLQFAEADAIAEYLGTGRRSSLRSYFVASGRIDAALDRLADLVAPLRSDRASLAVRLMRSDHRQWRDRAVGPLLAGLVPSSRRADALLLGQSRMRLFRIRDVDLGASIGLRAAQDAIDRERRFAQLAFLGLAGLGSGVFSASYAARHRDRLFSLVGRQTAIVRTLQRAFVSRCEVLPGACVGTAYLAATAGAQVGGDLFDFGVLAPGRAYVLIADVSGKGIDAAVDTALVKYAVKALVDVHPDAPGRVLEGVNRLFLGCADSGAAFVSVFLGVLDFDSGLLRYANAGHGPAFLRTSASVDLLAPTGPVVGLYASDRYATRDRRVRPGDTLFLATDGLTEARSRFAERGLLGEDAVARWLHDLADLQGQPLVDAVLSRVQAWAGGRITDDLAILAVCLDAPPPSPSPPVSSSFLVAAVAP